MAYTKVHADWKDYPDVTTPVEAADLEQIETGIFDAAADADAAQVTADAAVAKSLYDAQTILRATTDNTPAALTMGASTVLARLASGDIVAATAAEMATLLGYAAVPGYATTLPGSPVDKQEAILVDSVTAPTYQWRFRYNSGSSNADKWEFIGGADILSENLSSSAVTASSYVDPTNNVTITVPRAGIYSVEFFGTFTVSGSISCYISPKIGAAATSDTNAWNNLINTGSAWSPQRKQLLTLAASDVVKLQMKVSSGTMTIAFLGMTITPIRVS